MKKQTICMVLLCLLSACQPLSEAAVQRQEVPAGQLESAD